jgi:hypothetical protein
MQSEITGDREIFTMAALDFGRTSNQWQKATEASAVAVQLFLLLAICPARLSRRKGDGHFNVLRDGHSRIGESVQ